MTSGFDLGKATLDLEANLTPFEKNMRRAKGDADDMQHALDAVAAVATLAEEALNQVKMGPGQASETKASASGILSGVRGISEEARQAARDLDDVKLDSGNAAETTASGDAIDRKLKAIVGNANEARRSLESVRLAAAGAGGAGGGVTPGRGAGGGVGLLGAAIGGGALLAPAAGPATVGILGAIPVLAAAGAGSLGALALAFQGVGKAIGGDKKAFQDLGPAAQQFTLTVRSLDGWFDKLKQTAASSLFPGLTAGLKSALSPGTVSAFTQAITEFGHALGQAGAQWGKYFGSAEFRSIFGPLMASGARTVTTLSDAMLRLFDALGVLARAAIPFTTWLMNAIDHGARFVDTWLHAKDATGELGHAMDEARTSLTLVARLFGSLVNAVMALGTALYPVSKIAVKDLTDGLNGLAVIFRQAQSVIREVIATALTGLVTAVKLVVEGIRLMVEGWQHVLGQKAAIILAFTAIGAAILLFMGPTSAAITGAILAVGLIQRNWQTIVAFFKTLGQEIINALNWAWVQMQRGALLAALHVVEPFSHLPGVLGKWARDAKDSMQGELDKLHSPNMDWSHAAAQSGANTGAAWASAFTAVVQQVGDKAPAGYKPGSYGSQPSTRTNPGGFTPQMSMRPNSSYNQDQIRKLLIANGVPADVATNLAIISAHGEDPSGNPAALNNNPKTGDYSVGLFQENFLGQMGVDRTKKYAPQFGLSPTTPVAKFVDWLGKHPSAQAQIAYQIYQSQGYGAWTTAAGLGISGGGGGAGSPFGEIPPFTKNLGPKPVAPTGANLLPEALRNAIQAAKDKATTTQGSTAATWLHVELDDLDKARKNLEGQLKNATGKHKAAIEAELRTIDGQIASVNRQITVNLHAQATAIKAEFALKISAAKSNIGAAFSTLKATLDAQFQAATQVYIDSVLASKFFQGTDAHGKPLLTPSEQRLLDMQKVDSRKSLTDAIAQAQSQLESDLTSGGAGVQSAQDAYNSAVAAHEAAKASGAAAAVLEELQTAVDNTRKQLNDVINQGTSPAQLKVDQDALAAAKRQLDEYEVAATAADERAQADRDYADAVKKYQADRAELERQLNLQLDTFAKGLSDGTTRLSDLAGITDQFGLTLVGQGGITDDFATLGSAVQALAAILVIEAARLGAVSDGKDAAAAAARAAALVIPKDAPTLIPGTKINFAGFVAAAMLRDIPSLDVGGTVMETGIAMVHRGETFSGVSKPLAGGGQQKVEFNVNGFVGNPHELAMQIGRLLERATLRGVKFAL